MVTDARAATLRMPRRRPVQSYVAPGLGLALVGVVIAWLVENAILDWSTFVQLFLTGLTRGSLYGLVALGYTLVYGILELINFAHGDVFMIGGMLTATMVVDVFALGDNPSIGILVAAIFASLAVAAVACGVLNASIERIAYRPLRSAPRLVPLITAIG